MTELPATQATQLHWFQQLSARQIYAYLGVICAGLYAWTLSFPMVFDDDFYLRDNPLFTDARTWTSFTDIRGFVKRASEQGLNADLATNFILRPFTYVTFRLNYALTGFQPEGFRLVNILIHWGNSCLIFALVGTLLERPAPGIGSPIKHRELDVRFIAIVAATLFAVHPLAIESVTYIVQRFTSLVALFYLSALLCHFKAAQALQTHARLRWRVASVIATLLGMLTKEDTATLPVIAIFLDSMLLGTAWKTAIRRAMPLLACLPLIPLLVLLTAWAQHEGEWSLRNAIYLANSKHEPIAHVDYVLSQFTVVASYLRRLAWPAGLNLDPTWRLSQSLFEAPVLFSLALFGAMIFGSWKAYRNTHTDRGWAVIFTFTLWFFATISISSGLVPLPDLMAEHRAYLPSIGIFIAAAALLERCPQKWYKLRLHITCILALAFAASTLARNWDWRSGVSLWEDTVAKSPTNYRPWANLAYQFHLVGRDADAARCYQSAVKLKPDFLMGHMNLAMLLNNLKDYHSSASINERLIAEDDANLKHPFLVETLANSYIAQGRVKDAVNVATKAAEFVPRAAWPHLVISAAYSSAGTNSKALDHLRIAMRCNASPREVAVIQQCMARLLPATPSNVNRIATNAAN